MIRVVISADIILKYRVSFLDQTSLCKDEKSQAICQNRGKSASVSLQCHKRASSFSKQKNALPPEEPQRARIV